MVKDCRSCGKEIDKDALICVHCEADQRNFFRQHKLLTGMLIIAIIGLIGFTQYGGRISPPPDPPSNFWDESALDPNNSGSIKMTAAELVGAYGANELRANMAYRGKVVEITGTVSSIGNQFGRTFILLTYSTSHTFTNVQCFFNDAFEIGKVYNLNKGDQVTVSGIVEGKTMNIQVNNCFFVTGQEED